MRQMLCFILAATALLSFCAPASAQTDYDYISTDNLLVDYRVMSVSSPSSAYVAKPEVVAGFSSGSESLTTVRINTKVNTIHIGGRIITYSDEDTRRVITDDGVLYTGTGYLSRTGGETPFQILEYPDKTVDITISWPDTFDTTIIKCRVQNVKTLKVKKRKR